MIEKAEVISSRLSAVLRLAIPVLACCLLLDTAIYRSDFYAKVAEPDSNMGAVTDVRTLQARQFHTGARNVLVFGDSRIGEGFSALLANQEQARLNFINVGLPGSMPRTWWYLLRQFEREGYHPDAVVIGTIYAPLDRLDMANWQLDPSHEAQLLQLSDYPEYLASFHSDDLRSRALKQLLFPTLLVRSDLQSLLHNPAQRIDKLLHYRPDYLASVPLYPGREEQMPALEINADLSVADWGAATTEQKQVVTGYAQYLIEPLTPEFIAAHQTYLQTWYLKIADWCQQHRIKLVIFPLPRGPYHALLPVRTGPSVIATVLAQHPAAQVLPADTFDALEAPRFFFDTMHLNRSGREAISKQLATRIDAALAGDAR